MEDHDIRLLLLERNEEALIRIKEKYDKTCMRIAMSILNNEKDSEECVNDAYYHLWKSIPKSQPEDLKAYLFKTVHNQAIKRWEYLHAQKRSSDATIALEELIDFLPAQEVMAERQGELKELLNVFLRQKKKRDRILFIQRYFYGYTIKELAEKYHFSQSMIKMSLYRSRKELEKFLRKEGYRI